jgi:phosphorylase kinase alpha/beta subunit
MLTESLANRGLEDFKALHDQLKKGKLGSIPVYLSYFENLYHAARIENLDELGDQKIPHLQGETLISKTSWLAFSEEAKPLENEAELQIEAEDNSAQLIERLRTSSNLYEQIKLLDNLTGKNNLEHEIELAGQPVSLRELLGEVYERAGSLRIWNVVRHSAALLGKIDIELQLSVTSLLIHQKIIQVGKAFTDDSLIIRPLPFEQLVAKINKYCRDDHRDRVLTQEVLVYLGILIRSRPQLFNDLITIRVSYIILLIVGELARREQLLQEEAYERLLGLAPSEVQILLESTLEKYTVAGQNLQLLESMHSIKTPKNLSWKVDTSIEKTSPPEEGWLIWRRSQGTLHKAGEEFYTQIWQIFKQSSGFIIGDKLDRRNRLESRVILSDMTSGEKAFQLRIEYLLNKIAAPEYRYLTMEAMLVTASFGKQNPDLYIDDFVVFDILIGHAVRLAFTTEFPELSHTYHDHKADAWTHFYQLSPSEASVFIVKSIMFLLKVVGQTKD